MWGIFSLNPITSIFSYLKRKKEVDCVLMRIGQNCVYFIDWYAVQVKFDHLIQKYNGILIKPPCHGANHSLFVTAPELPCVFLMFLIGVSFPRALFLLKKQTEYSIHCYCVVKWRKSLCLYLVNTKGTNFIQYHLIRWCSEGHAINVDSELLCILLLLVLLVNLLSNLACKKD